MSGDLGVVRYSCIPKRLNRSLSSIRRSYEAGFYGSQLNDQTAGKTVLHWHVGHSDGMGG